MGSSSQIATKYGINGYTVRRWTQKYIEQGISAFSTLNRNTTYSAEFKMSCVELYLQGKMSMDQIVAKYNISANSVLRSWILMYNANRELKDYNPKKKVYGAARLKAAEAEFERFKQTWSEYPGAVDVWVRNWKHIEQLFNYGSAVRKVMYTTLYKKWKDRPISNWAMVRN